MGIDGIENLMGDDFPEVHDATDVPMVVLNHTEDGPGFTSEDELPESDFDEEDDQ